MLGFLVFAALRQTAPIPDGAYTMPELCRRLTAATGVGHVADEALRDYPVFVAVKSGDPGRVQRLVAAALRAEWRQTKAGWRLEALRPSREDGFAEFERMYREAARSRPGASVLPARDLYEMTIGEILRYGDGPSEYFRPLPREAPDEMRFVKVFRAAPGHFLFPNFEVSLVGLPKPVETLLGSDLEKSALTAEGRQIAKRQIAGIDAEKESADGFDRRDPVADAAAAVLAPVAEAIKPDFATALPDYSFVCLRDVAAKASSVGSVLRPLSQAVEWTIVDGAVVGRLAATERTYPTQAKRASVAKAIATAAGNPILSLGALRGLAASQPPGASEATNDLTLLDLGGTAVADPSIGDYPYHVRLYDRLTEDDWKLLRSGRKISASELSAGAWEALIRFLVAPGARLSPSDPDPAGWPSLRPDAIAIQAGFVEERVLIDWNSDHPQVTTVGGAAVFYERRRLQLGREPRYLPAWRRGVRLTVSPASGGAGVLTTFSEVAPDGDGKPAEWRQLPPDLAEEFKTTLARLESQRQEEGGSASP